MKLPFLNKNINTSSSSSWPWPSCHQRPKTLSFRNTTISQNPNFLNTAESAFPNSSDSAPTIFSSAGDDTAAPPPEPESIENVIEGLKSSERLIFERKGESNSILEEATKSKVPRRRNAGFVLLSLESNDPCSDFKRSMEEMVETHLLRDWRSLEKLLCWYLKVNVKSSHGFIFAAFFDMLAGLSAACKANGVSSSSATTSAADSCNVVRGASPSSPLSFYTSCSSTSCSSSDECCSSVRCVSSSVESPENEKAGVGGVDDEDDNNNIKRVYCLSSLLEMEKIKDIDVDAHVSC